MRVTTPAFALAVGAVLLTGAAGMLPAAPVPKHLMPKGPAFSHPTAVGTKWVYERGGREETWMITVAETKNAATVLSIETVGADGKTTPWHKLSVSEQGWAMTEEVGHAYEPAWCVLKLSVGAAHKWDIDAYRDDLKGRIKGSAVQHADREKVKVPAGELEAVRVESTYSIGENAAASKTTRWYAAGIGLIKMDEMLVLKSFTPGKD